MDPCFDVGVVAERGVVAEYCLDLTLRFVAVLGSLWIGVEKNATGRRNERSTGECRVVEPGAVQVVTRAVNTATVHLPNTGQNYRVSKNRLFQAMARTKQARGGYFA